MTSPTVGLRALVTAIGLGANLPQDAIYPVGQADAAGKPFDCAQQLRYAFPVGAASVGEARVLVFEPEL